jgi:hypothetical protein
VHVDLFWLALGLPFPSPVGEVADQFFLLRVDADGGLAPVQELLCHFAQVPELVVPVWVTGTFVLLGGSLQRVAEPPEQAPNAIGRDLVALTHKVLGQLVGRLGGPAQQRHRVAPGLRVDQPVQVFQYPWLHFGYCFPPRPWRSLAGVGLHACSDIGLGLDDGVAAHACGFGHSCLVPHHLGRCPRQHVALALVQVRQHRFEEARELFASDLHIIIILRAIYSAVDPKPPTCPFSTLKRPEP